jgi:hypothetical protein
VDRSELDLLADTLRKTMAPVGTAGTAGTVDAALDDLGWPEMLGTPAEPLVFALLGETGAHAAVLNDVVSGTAGGPPVPLPYAGGSWVLWSRSAPAGDTIDAELPVQVVSTGAPVPLATGRRALASWLVGTSRAMLGLARAHALDRVQFGRPIAGFQAVRHKLAESLVAVEGAAATLAAADSDLGALLAKATAGRAALLTAKHCQQVLGGIGFTAEHDLHRHVKRALFLDGLLGSSRELTREAGRLVRTQSHAPRLLNL